MKLQTVANRLAPFLPVLRCPLCGASLALLENRSLICEKRHCFDLSAKGYVNFAPRHNQRADPYDGELFKSRSRVFADGFYEPVSETLRDAVRRHVGECGEPATQAPLIADVGCGEGYYARALSDSAPRPAVIGVDISRDAIVAAARQGDGPCWMVADLTRLPLADCVADAVTDVLTPADYREFARVLKPSGLLYKLVPADDYLIEIRRAVAGRLRGGDFSNARVIEHLRAHAEVLERIPVRHTASVTPEQALDFLCMTPMTFGLPGETLAGIRFSEITVAMELLVCRLKKD